MPAYEPIPQRSSLERMPLPGNGARQVSAGGARAATAGSSRHFDDDESIALTPLTPGQAGLKASSTQQQSKAEHYKDDTEEDDDDDDLDLPELTYGLEEDSVPLRRSGGKRPEAEDALEDDNPVRKVVPETDDPTLPSLTFRVILIGTLLCVLGAAVAQTFFYKSNSPSFSSYFVIIVSLPTGRWLARALPPRIVRVPFIGSFSLNPGPFSIKEHLLIAVLVSSGASSSYATDILNIQELFFHQRMSTLASLTLLITTQVLGFGFAGLVQNALVKPPSMIFPSTLVTTSLFYTLHGAGGDGRVGASAAVSGSSALNMRDRLRFFTLVFVATILYQFFPSLIFPTLSSIAVLCLVDNSNRAFRVMSSGFHGFGILNFSLDWTAIGSSGPLYQPWVCAALNFYSGIGITMYILTPILYFCNFWDYQSYGETPISAGLFTTSFTKFNVSSVLTPENTLDPAKWSQQRPILLTPFFAFTYGISFAILTSMVSHVLLWHWKDMKRALRSGVSEDIHSRLMEAYDPVPRSWYIATVGLSLGASILLVMFSPLQLPVWALLLCVAIALVFLLPVGVIKATSDTGVGLNVITEFVAGYLMPGKPIANVAFKCYGYMTMSQALDLVTDMKLGQVPPKHMFVAQTLGTVIGNFLDGSEVDPTGQWDGRKVNMFYSASVIWGAVGPAEFFAGKYRKLYYGFLLGALAPVGPWLLHRYFSKRRLHRRVRPSSGVVSRISDFITDFPYDRIAWPIIFHGAGAPPNIPTNYMSQSWARRKHPAWFAKYNYILSAALDAGASINALIVFLLSITLLKYTPIPHWAGNPVLDSEHCKPGS
ncbi:hypothetical protein A4X09_0g1734 [Tilletia walkeri]|uniref:OPT family small oligopeptide transporter n=1 Tax=Tilletia walkeri TaxID=117179 RepID=A0A8X7NCB3_9BASI|nr:hypothetical protein A4X09_0g1734 [Tilletia walkeri]